MGLAGVHGGRQFHVSEANRTHGGHKAVAGAASDTLGDVLTSSSAPASRASLVRRLGIVTGLTSLLVLGTWVPAVADVPVGWEEAEPVSGLQFLLVLLILPLAAFAVVALLSWLSASRAPAYAEEESSWRNPEWFGGPTEGLGATSARSELPAGESAPVESGGASARW